MTQEQIKALIELVEQEKRNYHTNDDTHLPYVLKGKRDCTILAHIHYFDGIVLIFPNGYKLILNFVNASDSESLEISYYDNKGNKKGKAVDSTDNNRNICDAFRDMRDDLMK